MKALKITCDGTSEVLLNTLWMKVKEFFTFVMRRPCKLA
jgi:hypothetical protein